MSRRFSHCLPPWNMLFKNPLTGPNDNSCCSYKFFYSISLTSAIMKQTVKLELEKKSHKPQRWQSRYTPTGFGKCVTGPVIATLTIVKMPFVPYLVTNYSVKTYYLQRKWNRNYLHHPAAKWALKYFPRIVIFYFHDLRPYPILRTKDRRLPPVVTHSQKPLTWQHRDHKQRGAGL